VNKSTFLRSNRQWATPTDR